MYVGATMTVPHGEEGEIDSLQRLICSAVKLATHLRPDLDAILSIWMCQRVRKAAGLEPIEVLFIPANTKGIEEGIFAVDIGRGRGIKSFGEGYSIKQSILGGSAAMAIYRALPEADRDALKFLTRAISSADEGGENIHSITLKQGGGWFKHDVRHQVISTGIWHRHKSLMHVMGDHDLLRWWSASFEGDTVDGMKRRAAEIAADNATYELNGELAILPMGAPPQASGFAYQKGARLVLFSSGMGGDRWVLGLAHNKTPKDGQPFNINLLKPVLEEAFPGIWIHSAGIMAGWVSKSPLNCSEREFHQKRALFIPTVLEGFRSILEAKSGG